MTPSKSPFQKIGLIAKPDENSQLAETLESLHAFLVGQDKQVFCDLQACRILQLDAGLPLLQLAQQCDLAIVIGGDGTLLNSAREMVNANIPILGVNLGRLGFLVDISPDQMLDILQSVLNGHYQEDERFLLSCQIGGQQPQLALNDVVVHKWNIARMVELETSVNNSFIGAERSDGLIISTPTGSTAYALSGGGPLLAPGLDAIVLAPICPHTLSNRPLVVHSNSLIKLKVCGKTNPEHIRVTCDGQTSLRVAANETIKIAKHTRAIRLLHPADYDHYDILRTKLAWGEKHYH